jgi:hypothetical protein
VKVGLKGVKEEDADKIEALVVETLSELSVNGFDIGAVQASLNTVEFRLRKIRLFILTYISLKVWVT